jgi:hypothetical protein
MTILYHFNSLIRQWIGVLLYFIIIYFIGFLFYLHHSKYIHFMLFHHYPPLCHILKLNSKILILFLIIFMYNTFNNSETTPFIIKLLEILK